MRFPLTILRYQRPRGLPDPAASSTARTSSSPSTRLSDAEIRERIDLIRQDVLEAAEPDEPSDDELNAADLERRRDLTKARRKREAERIGRALDDVIPRCSPPAARP